MKLPDISMFKLQLLMLAALALFMYWSFNLQTSFGYFLAGVNFGGMIYFVVNIPQMREHDKAMKDLAALTTTTRRLNEEFAAMIERARK